MRSIDFNEIICKFCDGKTLSSRSKAKVEIAFSLLKRAFKFWNRNCNFLIFGTGTGTFGTFLILGYVFGTGTELKYKKYLRIFCRMRM